MSQIPKIKPKTATVLTTKREQLGLSIAEAAQATHINKRYLTAFETGKFEGIAHTVFTLGQLRRYSNFLSLDAEALTTEYLNQRGPLPASKAKWAGRRVTSPIVTSKVIIGLIAAILALALIGYVIWQAVLLASPPRLVIIKPAGDQELIGSQVEVKGYTAPGASVWVNDQVVYVDDNGNFSINLTLPEGLQTIKVVAENKVGQASHQERSLLVKGIASP